MSRGLQRERAVRDWLQERDWIVVRAAGSLGDFDLLAVKAGETCRLIEVKSTARGPYHGFGPQDRATLKQLAEWADGGAYLAWWPPRGKLNWIHSSEWPDEQAATPNRSTRPQRGIKPQKGGRQPMTSMQQVPIGHTTGLFASVQPDQFGQTLDDLYQSARAISNAVVDEVEGGRISPVQGAAVVANVTGSLFGWPEFHRELRPSDLASVMLGQIAGDGQ